MKYLLDTCVISELIKKRPNKSVTAWIKAQDEPALFLSVLTFGEIEKGIGKLADVKRKLVLRHWVDHDLKRRFTGRILSLDYEAACRWGVVSAEAELKGKPVPVLDGLLAATALIQGMTFVTRNTDDVEPTGVPTLNPWLWQT